MAQRTQLDSRASRARVARLVLFGVAYVVIGVATSALAKTASTPQGTSGWRLAGWAASFAVFLAQIIYTRLRLNEHSRPTAREAAIAAAIGAFLLAAVGPVRAHWGAPDFGRASVLSLIVWPIITGVPAFIVALGVAAMLGKGTGSISSEPRA